MSYPYQPAPDHHVCPECDGEASNEEHPCTTWFTCPCGYFFDTDELHQAEEQKLQWWQQIDNDDNWIRRQLDAS